MTRPHIALLLTILLTLFVAIDHNHRPDIDHVALEKWRPALGADGACAPCGAVCTNDSK